MSIADLRRRFEYNAKTATDNAEMHNAVRKSVMQTVGILNEIVPAGHEKDMMIDALDVALFWANAGIARRH